MINEYYVKQLVTTFVYNLNYMINIKLTYYLRFIWFERGASKIILT